MLRESASDGLPPPEYELLVRPLENTQGALGAQRRGYDSRRMMVAGSMPAARAAGSRLPVAVMARQRVAAMA